MKPNYSLLRISFFLIVSFFILIGTKAQKLKKVNEVQRNIISYCTDTNHNYYLALANGSIEKYDSTHQLISRYSINTQNFIHSISVWNSFKLLILSQNAQEITILDRFTAIPKIYSTANFTEEIVTAISPAIDGNLWILTTNPQTLKKVNLISGQTIFEQQIQTASTINQLVNFQNFLAFSTDNKVSILDQFGIKINEFFTKNIKFIQFQEQFLYIFTSEEILKINFTSNTSDSKKIKIPLKNCSGGFVLNGKIFLVGGNEVYEIIQV